MRNQNSKAMALCGVAAALAVTIGALAGMIPVATYVIPVLQCMILQFISIACPRRYGWSWYAVVTVLNFLLCPDKEAAAMFLFIGYYPILKPWFDTLRAHWLAKLLFFAVSTSAMYGLLILLLGMEELIQEFSELGVVLGIVCGILGCITFLMLDVILGRIRRKFA